MIPRRFIGENILHLPTVKTHVFTTTTGAMKNAFGGLLNERRHWTHPVIHETLVDLLMIQKKIHRGVFAVMDGTFAGDGPGPRCMVPHAKNVILASADQVAIDAVAARLMGFDPLSIKYIRLAHDAGLGCGDPREIEIVGDAAGRRRELALRRTVRADDVCVADAAPHLLGAAAQADRMVAQDRAGAVGVHRQRALSRQLLVSLERRARDRSRCSTVRGAGCFENWEQLTPTRTAFRTSARNRPRHRVRARARWRSRSASWAPASRKPPSLPAAAGDGRGQRRIRREDPLMADFNIRSDSVDVEQIMKQIRARIREKRGVDYTEEQIRELATVRLEKFLDPKNLRSDLLEQFRRSRPALPGRPGRPSNRRTSSTTRRCSPRIAARCA